LSELVIPILYQLCVGGIGGFFVGYVVKKVTKIIAVILGIFLLSLISLAYIEAISVNYNELIEVLSKLAIPEQAAELLMPILANLPFVASFIIAFLIGFTKG
jgi:uncharacterized membrane protein (Fun14 family)